MKTRVHCSLADTRIRHLLALSRQYSLPFFLETHGQPHSAGVDR